MVVVVSEAWDDSAVKLYRFTRSSEKDSWTKVDAGFDAEIGHTGLGWGIGLHGDGAPNDLGGPIKKEGDGRSPAGAFSLGAAYGYDAKPPSGTKVDYTKLDKTWRCVDDPKSKHYNDVMPESAAKKVDWKSAETMRRSDELYRWVLLVDHNRIRADGDSRTDAPTPGGGSCIFFHIWREPGGATVGCAAMDQANLETILAWLEPASNPSTVMLPRAEYAQLAKPWGLPAL